MSCATASKNVLIFFNCLFFIVGAILLAVGFYILFTPYSFEILAVLDNGIIQAGVYSVITIGVIIFFIAALGLLGACCQSRGLLVLYMMIIFIIMVVQIGVCAAVVQYRTRVTDFVSESLTGTMDWYTMENGTDSFSVAWNSIQIYFECCGTNNYTDWSDSVWDNNNNITKFQAGAQYPVTCCAVSDPSVVFSGTIDLAGFRNMEKCYGGGGEPIPNTYMAGNGTGCFTSFEGYVVENIKLLGGFGIGLAAFEGKQGTGCFTSFEGYVVENIKLLGGFGIGLAAFELLLFFLSLIACCTLDRKEEVV